LQASVTFQGKRIDRIKSAS